MARNINRLNDIKIKALKTPGMHPDGGGLYLKIGESGAKSWILRYMLKGKATKIGLGAYPAVKVAAAREAAAEARSLVSAGIDPVADREAKEAAARAAEEAVVPVVTTFAMAAAEYIAEHEASWRNAKHRQQWRSTIATYAGPVIGQKNVAEITTDDIYKVLQPIWKTKVETAMRLRGRIEVILDWCEVRELRGGKNPAIWRGHLKHLLAKQPSKRLRVKHHPSLPWADMPNFMAELFLRDSISAKALQFTALTAKRTSEVILAEWSEFDLDKAVWRIPDERMKIKTGFVFEEPLSPEAIAVLRSVPVRAGNRHVFAGGPYAPLSNMAMLQLLRGMRPPYTPHGFRATFRTWAGEETHFPSDLLELCLAHSVGSDVQQAYQRSQLREKRRPIMEAWAAFCCSGIVKKKSAA